MSNFIPVIGEYYLIRIRPTMIAKLVATNMDLGLYESYTFEMSDGNPMATIGSTFTYPRLALPTIYKILNNVA